MDVAAVVNGFKAKLRKDGLGSTLSLIWYRFTVRWLEHRLGIDTDAIITCASLGYLNVDSRDYVPTNYWNLRRAFRLLTNIGSDDVFLDFGSGLGRVVIFAALFHKFRRVIGMEVSEHLNAVARQNVERARPRLRCQQVEIHTADVTRYDVPDDATVLYFFNPFVGKLLESCFAAIKASIRRNPRSVRLLCMYPRGFAFGAQIERQQWLRREAQTDFPDGMQCCLLRVECATELSNNA
jgi:SAM-dependent methyltransferase